MCKQIDDMEVEEETAPPPPPPPPPPRQPSPPPIPVHNLQLQGLSWQCYNGLMMTGPSKLIDNSIAQHCSHVGPLSKSLINPLILTYPYASTLRENMIQRTLQSLKEKLVNAENEDERYVF